MDIYHEVEATEQEVAAAQARIARRNKIDQIAEGLDRISRRIGRLTRPGPKGEPDKNTTGIIVDKQTGTIRRYQ